MKDSIHLFAIAEILYPDKDRGNEWAVDTVERVAAVIDAWLGIEA